MSATTLRIKRMLPAPVRELGRWMLHCIRYDRFVRASYSQEGEDLILDRFFEGKPAGFYVDVGAHHPRRFSNTYLFYRRGWCGINIDAMPGSMAAFRKVRPRDTNLEIPVLKERARLRYFQFNEPALNGFSSALSESRDGSDGYHITGVVELEGRPLHEILTDFVPAARPQIDFLTIDVEGLDLAVLESNDWLRFRPSLVLVELAESRLSEIAADPAARFLAQHGYEPVARTVKTVFFATPEFLKEHALAR